MLDGVDLERSRPKVPPLLPPRLACRSPGDPRLHGRRAARRRRRGRRDGKRALSPSPSSAHRGTDSLRHAAAHCSLACHRRAPSRHTRPASDRRLAGVSSSAAWSAAAADDDCRAERGNGCCSSQGGGGALASAAAAQASPSARGVRFSSRRRHSPAGAVSRTRWRVDLYVMNALQLSCSLVPTLSRPLALRLALPRGRLRRRQALRHQR